MRRPAGCKCHALSRASCACAQGQDVQQYACKGICTVHIIYTYKFQRKYRIGDADVFIICR